MRKLFAAVTAIGAVVLIASPVRAKGIEHAHFSGPGLPSDGVTIVRGNYNQLVKTGLIERKRKSLTALGLSRPDLGPAYRAEYRMDYAPRVTLHQTIYPYAKDGPVTFTPRGQHLGQDYESFRGGWYAAPSGLLPFLVVHGFPRHNPKHDDTRPIPAGERPKSMAQPALWWQWVIGAAFTAIGCTGAVILRRPRRSLRPNSS